MQAQSELITKRLDGKILPLSYEEQDFYFPYALAKELHVTIEEAPLTIRTNQQGCVDFSSKVDACHPILMIL